SSKEADYVRSPWSVVRSQIPIRLRTTDHGLRTKDDPMQCQFCSNPATVHLTTLTGFKTKKVHLCEACAKKHQVVDSEQAELNIQAVVHYMLSQQLGPEAEELARLTCPECGIKYMEFRGDGRLGCPQD